METLKNEMGTMGTVENLTPIEKELYQKCLSHFPEMTIMAWKELRKNAQSTIDPGAKQFYIYNNFLSPEKPDKDDTNEWRSTIN